MKTPIHDLDWSQLIFYALAVFRLAVLLSEDTGPARVFSKLRSFLKREAKQHPALRKTAVHEGVGCLRCSSVWIAAPVAAYAYFHDELPPWFAATGDIFLICCALSAGAILLNRIPKQ